MMITAYPPGINAENGAAGLEQPVSDAAEVPPTAAPAAPMVAQYGHKAKPE